MAKVRPFGDMARSLAENGTEVWKYIGRAERPLLAFHQAAPVPIRSNRSEPASSQGMSSHVLRRSGTRTASTACETPSAFQSKSLALSLLLFLRSLYLFALS